LSENESYKNWKVILDHTTLYLEMQKGKYLLQWKMFHRKLCDDNLPQILYDLEDICKTKLAE